MLVLLLSGGSSFAAERTIYEKRTTLWSVMDPGYSFSQCVKPAKPEDEAVCKRRQAWPDGSEKVNIRTPRNGIGTDNEYAVVKINDKYGWVKVGDLSADHKTVIRNTVLSEKPNGAGTVNIKVKAKSRVQEFAPSEVTIGDDVYYFAEFTAADANSYAGWIARSALSKSSKSVQKELQTEAKSSTTEPPATKPCERCVNGGLPQVESHYGAVNKAIRASGMLIKDAREFERFACNHSDQRLYDIVQVQSKERGKAVTKNVHQFSKEQFCQFYAGEKGVRQYVERAAAAFGLPDSVVGCLVMIESALHFDPSQPGEYRGRAQFGRPAVNDLKRYINMPAYSSMWKDYMPDRPISDFKDENVRLKDDLEIQVGAAAFLAKWLLTHQMPLTGCKDCTLNPNSPNRKEILMMVAGYNWSPYGLGKVANLSPDEMKVAPIFLRKNGDDETHRYFRKMERCLEPKQYAKFEFDKESGSYRDRGGQCEAPCP